MGKIRTYEKGQFNRFIKQQSKLSFNGIHKAFEEHESYLFKQHKFLFDKPIYLGFSVLELSKLLLYENNYDNLKPYFGQESLQLKYMLCDSFVLSIRTENIIDDLGNPKDLFDFSNADEIHGIYIN